ncbi:tRNA (N(6)-L-threonylcarbamoyladenosine(37)-C(2))-methylthiotransferase MtaB [Pseudohoeflea suaedae]|uniref:tRNA (N(6)-L-threonylcarbamoyladenosine(37)-C(2))-methylthiotransferase MtaB n=1 Tax=Pseudohoeflea suaedae TaxID=877384 RepID=A0A4R5PQF2_9HYPH|nr:tRNA (N(6)-L-threonylcarbamoyladenosine(37)-C(2))-methylthiotransferase MtaB [Pseudohoeflea suaedae]TDH39362.1 tRNA (N(6)-L-threonylcarbamoyladenosine(37)-C(2))-methylthiotransferase MtaB [Pseudohoeflea suaedae]
MRPVKTLTFGCRLNIYESEAISKAAAEAGLSDTLVVNTCAVTAEAVRSARQQIRKARRENPDIRIVVSGCAAQTEPETFAAMPEVDAVIGNDLKTRAETYRSLPDFGARDSEKIRVNDIMSVRETAPQMVDSIEGHTRAFVQVQNGCDHRCTFCIIPYGRGNSRSVPMGAVVEQVGKLVDNGYREIVLTGVDATSYGTDLPGRPTLGRLVQTVLREVPDIERLRLSSIDSIEVDEALMDAVATDRRFMPYLHLSLQHGDNLILKRMKRRHSREEALAFVETMRSLRPGFAFGADLIAGFPTETDAHFQRSLDLVEEAGIAFLHVFPYSPRPGTPAARMPQLDRGLIKDRAARLRQAGARSLDRHLDAMVARGGVHDVLVERNGIARTENFTPVRVQADWSPGPRSIRIAGHSDGMLTLMDEPVRDRAPAGARQLEVATWR